MGVTGVRLRISGLVRKKMEGALLEDVSRKLYGTNKLGYEDRNSQLVSEDTRRTKLGQTSA